MARQLSKVIDSVKEPRGTKDAPGRTCGHLAASHPDFESGNYWIDPNQGSTADSFEAYCDMKTRQTCVHAAPSQVPKGIWYVGPKRRLWFGEEVKKGFLFTYATDVSQFQFLQALSSSAVQNVTVHCRNTVAYYDAAAKSYKKAAIFASMDDREIVDGRRGHHYKVPIDECKGRRDVWARTVFQFNAERTTRLPIEDIAPADLGGDNQGFGLEIGPVCFA